MSETDLDSRAFEKSECETCMVYFTVWLVNITLSLALSGAAADRRNSDGDLTEACL